MACVNRLLSSFLITHSQNIALQGSNKIFLQSRIISGKVQVAFNVIIIIIIIASYIEQKHSSNLYNLKNLSVLQIALMTVLPYQKAFWLCILLKQISSSDLWKFAWHLKTVTHSSSSVKHLQDSELQDSERQGVLMLFACYNDHQNIKHMSQNHIKVNHIYSHYQIRTI